MVHTTYQWYNWGWLILLFCQHYSSFNSSKKMGMARNGSKPINSYHSWGNKHPIHQLFWGSIQVPQNFTEKKKSAETQQ